MSGYPIRVVGGTKEEIETNIAALLKACKRVHRASGETPKRSRT